MEEFVVAFLIVFIGLSAAEIFRPLIKQTRIIWRRAECCSSWKRQPLFFTAVVLGFLGILFFISAEIIGKNSVKERK